MKLREWLGLLGLTCATFVFNTSEFVPIGLLCDISASFGMTEAAAGSLISVYAWMVMFLSLPLMLMVSRMGLRKLMLCTMGVFVLFHGLSGVATSFGTLMAARIGVACSHAVFWSIVSPLAVRIVPERNKALALSMVVTGSSVAMILGMPLGRFIGLYLGWRMTFLFIGGVSLLTLVYMLFTLPDVPSRGGFRIRQLPELMRNKMLVRIFVLVVCLAGAYYVAYSYIEPFLKNYAGMSEELITLTLMLFGVMGIIGSMLFSKFYPMNPKRFISVSIGALAFFLVMMNPATVTVPTAIFSCIMLAMAVTGFNVSLQSELMRVVPQEATAVSMSMYSGFFNMGIASGSMIGSLVVAHGALPMIGFVGGAIALAGFLFWRVGMVKMM